MNEDVVINLGNSEKVANFPFVTIEWVKTLKVIMPYNFKNC